MSQQRDGAPNRPAVQDCPRTKGTIVVVVKRRGGQGVDGQGVAGANVVLEGPSPGNAVTNGAGLATFPARTPATNYQVKVSLPGKPNMVLEPFTPTVGVGANATTIARVTAHATGTVVVRVLDDLGRRVEAQALVNAPLLGDTLKLAHQAADIHKTVPAGRCRVSAMAKRADVYLNASDDTEVDVPEGGSVRATIVLPLMNLVVGQVEPAQAELWFVRPDPQPAPAPLNPAPPPSVRSQHVEAPVAVRLGITETRPEKSYTGGGTLDWDDQRVVLYRDAACATPALASGLALTNAELKAGLTLYAKGRETGVSPLQLNLAPSADVAIVLRPPVGKTLAVREINIVEPMLKVEHKVVLLDRKLARYQADEAVEADKFIPTPTFIDLSVTQRLDQPAYAKTATLQLAPANVDVFTDAACQTRFNAAQPIAIDRLTGAQPLRLYLKAKTRGRFTAQLRLAPSGDPHILVEHPSTVPMGVVELKMELHEHDTKAVAALTCDPDTATYAADLHALALPDQVVLTDEQKVKQGRLLHQQDGVGSFGRAKLVIKKLDAADWPDGVDDYRIVVSQNTAPGALALWDAETAGAQQVLPLQIDIAQLKGGAAADKVLWVEGSTRTNDWRKMHLDLGVDRVGPLAGGVGEHHHVALADKAVKRKGDGARFTVVEITRVELHYEAKPGKAAEWDAGQNRYYINLRKDPDGRDVTLRATITPPLKDVTLHLMLAPDRNNRLATNWGVAMPATWTWHTITADIKHRDRKQRTAFLSVSGKTDAKGQVEQKVRLSRVGGDQFWPAAHIDQDPHLAKYIDGDPNLGTRVPKRAAAAVQVWRKFWYQEVRVTGATVAPVALAVPQYTRVHAEMVAAPVVSIPAATAQAMNPPSIYPKYMVYLNGGNADAVVVSNKNKSAFFSHASGDASRPVQIPVVVCDAQWDSDGYTADVDQDDDAANFPININTGKLVLDPPLQGGTLLKRGRWLAAEPDPVNAGQWVNVRRGKLRAADVDIDPARGDRNEVRVRVPAGVNPVADTVIWIEGLVVRGAEGPFLGEYSGKTQTILAVYNQRTQAHIDDFPNTVSHEVGHAFRQVETSPPAGVPAHPNQYYSRGSHCNAFADHCLMYESGPKPGCLNQYCDVCHPYVLTARMDSFAK